VGNLVHYGMNLVFQGQSNRVAAAISKMYKTEKKDIRKRFPEISTDDEQKLINAEIISVGMIRGYVQRYKKFVQTAELVKNEVPIKVNIGQNIYVVGNVDNLVKSKKEISLVEIKTSRYINKQYVQNIKIDFQTSTYWHMLKRLGVKLHNILYKVILKPSIRQTKKETKGQFLERLGGWYDSTENESKFHIERMKEPGISEEGVINTIKRIVAIMRSNEYKEEAYYQNFDSCIREWGRCDYYEICHEGGETKENMLLFKIREKFSERQKRKEKKKT